MGTRDPRMTRQTLAVLQALLSDPDRAWAGSEVAVVTGLMSGTLYPILSRLENSGWLRSSWELLDPSEAGRPRKRLYELTAYGLKSGERALSSRVAMSGALSWAW